MKPELKFRKGSQTQSNVTLPNNASYIPCISNKHNCPDGRFRLQILYAASNCLKLRKVLLSVVASRFQDLTIFSKQTVPSLPYIVSTIPLSTVQLVSLSVPAFTQWWNLPAMPNSKLPPQGIKEERRVGLHSLANSVMKMEPNSFL